jgi:hypothetical protein
MLLQSVVPQRRTCRGAELARAAAYYRWPLHLANKSGLFVSQIWERYLARTTPLMSMLLTTGGSSGPPAMLMPGWLAPTAGARRALRLSLSY